MPKIVKYEEKRIHMVSSYLDSRTFNGMARECIKCNMSKSEFVLQAIRNEIERRKEAIKARSVANSLGIAIPDR